MTRFDELYEKTHPHTEETEEKKTVESPVEGFDEEESEEAEVTVEEGEVVTGDEPEEGEEEDA